MMDSTIAIDHTLVEMVFNFGGWGKILILGGSHNQKFLLDQFVCKLYQVA